MFSTVKRRGIKAINIKGLNPYVGQLNANSNPLNIDRIMFFIMQNKRVANLQMKFDFSDSKL